MATPCIEAILKAAAGKISERDATKLLRDLTNKAKAISIEEGIPLANAAARVVAEAVKIQKMNAALSHRATMANYKAQLDIADFIANGVKKGRLMGDSLIDYLVQAYNSGHYQAGKALNRYFSELEKAGVKNEANKGGSTLSHDATIERWQLSAGKPFATENIVAQKIASIQVPMRKEVNAKLRLYGSDIHDEQSYAGVQTHDPDLLRRAGVPAGIGNFLWGKENMHASYDVWQASVMSKNIDWVKTVAGTTPAERQSFLRNFHKAIYSGVHGGPIEMIEPDRFHGHGSLLEKINSQRLLWFKDPISQWEYNQEWGIKDFNAGFVMEMISAHRQIAMLQHLGASTERVFHEAVRRAKVAAKDMPNAQEQERSLSAERIQGSYDLLAGKAGTTRHPWRALFFTSLKDWFIASRGGGILFSMAGDPAFMKSELALQGFSNLDKFAAPLHLGLLKTPQGRQYLQNAGFLANAWSGLTAERWSNDHRPDRRMAKLLNWEFKWTGVTKVTDKERALMTLLTGHKLGQEVDLPFDKMNSRTRALLERYQFTPEEWDAMRSTKYDLDGLPVIDPTQMQFLDDTVIDGLLKKENTTATPQARARKRLDLESKLGAYTYDRTLAGVPTPGLREREFMTGHATPRGEWNRELRDLFFTFKGFPVTVAMRNKQNFGILAQSEGRFSAFRHVAALVAQATAMGYIGLTAFDLLKGKEPRKLVQDGQLNWKLFLNAMQRGSGLGIYGDYLFSEYDSHTRGFLKSVAGPALGDLDPLFSMATKGRQSLYEEEGGRKAESLGYDAFRFLEGHTSILNMFYLKFFLDHFILWHLKEGLSPGVLRRQQKRDRDLNWQEWWLEPVD